LRISSKTAHLNASCIYTRSFGQARAHTIPHAARGASDMMILAILMRGATARAGCVALEIRDLSALLDGEERFG
jgi:hypothetical protein